MFSLQKVLLLCGFSLLSSSPLVSSCYCGIGFQSGYTPSGFSSQSASWLSPSPKGQALTTTTTPTRTTFMNGQTTLATGGLTWNTSPGNQYGNTYAIDGFPTTFATKTWTTINLPTTVTSPLTGTPYFYTSTYYLTGTLNGCVIPLGQTKFVASIQFQPYSYYESGNTASTYHADSVKSYVQPAGSSSQTAVPVYSDGTGYAKDTFFTGQFALTLGTNYFYVAVGNTDITHSPSGGCPFIYKYTITCTQGTVNGDPQFTGFRGQDYQIHGQSGTVYNILSTPSFQYNALFSFLSSGRCRVGTLCFSHPGNYFGAVGMLIRDEEEKQTTSIKVISGGVEEGMKVLINEIVLTPSDHSLTIGSYTIQYPNSFELLLESNELNLKLSNSDYFINQDVSIGNGLLSAIVDQKQIKRVNQTRADELESVLPHGLLGQTWQLKQHNNRWKFIAGHLYDYIVDGLNGKEFKYNRFQY